MRRVLLVPSGDMVDGQMGHATRCRCNRAIELWNKKKYDLIIVSGGIIVCEGETTPAAMIMKAYLVEKGIPEEAILVEPGAVDSSKNIQFSIALLRRTFGMEKFRIYVVSWFQHALRLWVNGLFGFRKFVWIKLAWYRVSPLYCVMEVFMFIYTLCDPKGTRSCAQNLRLKRRSP